MNILVIIHNQDSSGVFEKVRELCSAYAKLGHRVTLFCTSSKNRLKGEWKMMDSVSVFKAPDLLSGRLRQGVDLWNTIQRIRATSGRNIDIIHSIDCRPNVIIPSLYLKAFRKIPMVLSWWDLYGSGGTALERSGALYSATFGLVESFFETKFRKYADYSTVVSTSLFQKLANLGYQQEKILLSRIGCEPKNPYNRYTRSGRRALGVDPSVRILVCTGSLFAQDLSLLLDSLKILKMEKNREMPLTILIGNHDVPSEACSALNVLLRRRIPAREEFLRLLAASDFGLLPMRCTPANMARWPSKSSDYWSGGLPVISTPINDFSVLFSQHSLGFLSASDTPESYAKAIDAALNSSADDRARIRFGIQQFVRAELSWDSIAQELTMVFQSLVEESAQS